MKSETESDRDRVRKGIEAETMTEAKKEAEIGIGTIKS